MEAGMFITLNDWKYWAEPNCMTTCQGLFKTWKCFYVKQYEGISCRMVLALPHQGPRTAGSSIQYKVWGKMSQQLQNNYCCFLSPCQFTRRKVLGKGKFWLEWNIILKANGSIFMVPRGWILILVFVPLRLLLHSHQTKNLMSKTECADCHYIYWSVMLFWEINLCPPIWTLKLCRRITTRAISQSETKISKTQQRNHAWQDTTSSLLQKYAFVCSGWTEPHICLLCWSAEGFATWHSCVWFHQIIQRLTHVKHN